MAKMLVTLALAGRFRTAAASSLSCVNPASGSKAVNTQSGLCSEHNREAGCAFPLKSCMWQY
jgi:hypothetical protein